MKRLSMRTGSPRVHLLRQQFGTPYSCGFLNKMEGVFSNSGAYLDCNRMTTSFQVSGPSNIKHLYPSEENLALSRTTRLRSSTTNLKCTKLYGHYEYELENSSQSLTNAARIRRGNWFARFLPANHKAQKRKSFLYV